jgi:hypothetical protein
MHRKFNGTALSQAARFPILEISRGPGSMTGRESRAIMRIMATLKNTWKKA